MHHLEFEKPVLELEGKIAELKHMTKSDDAVDMSDEIARLETKAQKTLKTMYDRLSPQEKVQVSRHPERPHFGDYIKHMIEDFTPLAGDRLFGEDEALIGGLGRFRGRSCVIMGQEKGSDTDSRIRHNFGMGKPEGYRKAIRLMEMAGRFGLPVVTLVDTSGAFPGVEAEERGQAEAIARSTEACLALPVPMVAAIVGEGGSGGAVALASAERVLMMEHAVYSVISPEGCASILWRTAEKAPDAAEAMKVTAQDLKGLGVIDRIVPEPVGGAHRDPVVAATSLGAAIAEELDMLSGYAPHELKRQREDRFLAIAG